jgi:hypothetical protein
MFGAQRIPAPGAPKCGMKSDTRWCCAARVGPAGFCRLGGGFQMRQWVREHGLLLANVLLFLVFFVGMVVTGAASYSEDQLAHGQAAVSIGEYLATGAFVEATFENWESEFLQMGMYVVLTAYLFQKGSSESKPVGRPLRRTRTPAQPAKDLTLPGRSVAALGR